MKCGFRLVESCAGGPKLLVKSRLERRGADLVHGQRHFVPGIRTFVPGTSDPIARKRTVKIFCLSRKRRIRRERDRNGETEQRRRWAAACWHAGRTAGVGWAGAQRGESTAGRFRCFHRAACPPTHRVCGLSRPRLAKCTLLFVSSPELRVFVLNRDSLCDQSSSGLARASSSRASVKLSDVSVASFLRCDLVSSAVSVDSTV